MRVLDLFCGAGGSSMGLHRAGFEVVGVDIEPQPHYPFDFIQADALEVDLDGYDGYWASPPCEAYAKLTKHRCPNAPKYIEAIRERLWATNKPYIIENVPGALLRAPYMLCGAMFGMHIIRHRLFEANFLMLVPKHQPHNGSPRTGEYVTVAGHGGNGKADFNSWCEAMGIDWMVTREEIVQAVPPIYAEFLGRQLKALKERRDQRQT